MGSDGQPDIIVSASDTKVSFGVEYSADGTVKSHMLRPGWDWVVMIAGSDISQYQFVINRARKLLHGRRGMLPDVVSAVKKAYQDQLREVITDDLLSRYDMTLDEFKQKGEKQLLPDVYAEISLKIKIYSLGCALLVYGLDEKGVAHIFTVRNPGKVEVYDKPGFWAIGNGARSALSMLCALGQVRGRTTFDQTIYNVLASKYFSESASEVGHGTYLWSQQRGSVGCSFKSGLEEDRVRAIWEADGKPKTGADAIKIIGESDFRFLSKTRKSTDQQ